MFRIRKEQLDHFRAKGRAAYLRRLAAWIEETYPGRWRDLEPRVRAAVEKADRLGFTVELETTQLVLLLLELGIDADEKHPWFAAVLANRDLVPLGKARKLVAEARARGVDGIDALDVSQPELTI